MIKRLAGWLCLFVFILAATGCSKQETSRSADQELLYQVSTINALLSGAYDGQSSIAEIKKYGDLGIGTFAALDGEMIILDGRVYKAKYDGTVEQVDDQQMTPFSSVTFFNEDQRLEQTSFADYASLQKTLDSMVKNRNLFYAFKITGDFNYVKVRSVPPQEKPYPPLADVTKSQPVFEYQKLKGTLVGFWCPDYVSGINVPGYHLHFLSEDNTKGGHLLEADAKNVVLIADQTPSFQMTLSEDNEFSKIKLNEDKSDELEKVEK